MKNLLIVLALLVFATCKKKEDPPEPVTPDYADSLVGTYVGTEAEADGASANIIYTNNSKTMTITKLEKNRIQLSQFNAGINPKFTLSDGGSGKIKLTPELFSEHQTYSNTYTISSKDLSVSIKNSNPDFWYYDAVKQ